MNTIGAPEPSTQSKVKSSDEHARGLIQRPIATLLRALFVLDDEGLSAADAASTLFRFFRSKHVADLRFIFVAAIAVFFIHVFVIQVVHLVLSPKSDSSQALHLNLIVHKALHLNLIVHKALHLNLIVHKSLHQNLKAP